MCNCLKESEARMIAYASENITDLKEIVKGSDTGYVNKVLSFTRGLILVLPFEVKYILLKKDGSEGKPKIEKINIFPSYCPFCGEKAKEEDEEMKPVNS